MNKRQLIEALERYDDDAPVVVARDNHIAEGIKVGWYSEHHKGARIFGISDDLTVVRLEL